MKRPFLTCLAAYLTGWVIAQSLFQRVWRYVTRTATEANMDGFHKKIAGYVVDELESRHARRHTDQLEDAVSYRR